MENSGDGGQAYCVLPMPGIACSASIESVGTDDGEDG